MKPTKELLKKYARLLVRMGANVQKGQVVSLSAAADQHEFACMVMEECYLAGAKKVDMEWSCDLQTRLNYLYADEAVLGEVQSWEVEKQKQAAVDLPCRIRIHSDDPDALAGIDSEKISKVMRKRMMVLKHYRDAIDGRHQWLVASVPSKAWAMKCFPEDTQEVAMEKLWDAIFKTVRITEDNDPVAEWQAHCDFMLKKADWLNRQHFTSLKYQSANGTDFTIGLIPQASWAGAGCDNKENGAYYVPNMPTEEVFTTPMAGVCEGTLVSVKPLSWNGQLIEDFSITFENGKAVSCNARKGQELLEQMIAMDDGACMLGEVALVPKESPINQCGFLFYNTLFDENACCHMALGMGYKDVFEGFETMSREDAKALGCNDSMIHVDFMVGADDLSIVGIKEDGTQVPVFVDGTWA